MERFVIRNYGPSRNLPDGRGSYIFIERDRVRGTSDPELAKLFATYPEIHVADRGEDVAPPFVPSAPPGPPPPPDQDDEKPEEDEQKKSYEALTKRDLLGMAKLRGIPTSGLRRDDLIVALKKMDSEEKVDSNDNQINYEILSYGDLQDIAKERNIRFVGISKSVLVATLQADDKN